MKRLCLKLRRTFQLRNICAYLVAGAIDVRKFAWRMFRVKSKSAKEGLVLPQMLSNLAVSTNARRI